MTWHVILDEGPGEGGSGGAAGGAGQAQPQAEKDAAEQTKKQAPIWAMIGRFIAPLVAVAGVLAFVIQMMRRSKIFSVFMDSLLTILSSLIDILFIPLIPLLGPVLTLFLDLIPIAQKASTDISAFLKDPWTGLKTIFAAIVNLPKNIGNFLGDIFDKLGLSGIGDAFKNAGSIITGALQKIEPKFNTMINTIQGIWEQSGVSIWTKIGESASTVWDFIKASWPDVLTALKNLWSQVFLPGILTIVSDLFGGTGGTIYAIINDVFHGKFADAWSTFTTFIGGEVSKVWDNFYNTDLRPTWLKFYNDDLKPRWVEFVDIVKVLWGALTKDIGANFSWLINTAKAYLDWIFPIIGQYATWLFGTGGVIAVLWNNLLPVIEKGLLAGLLDMLDMIGQGVIRGVVMAVADVIAICFNQLITLVNMFITGMNRLKIFGQTATFQDFSLSSINDAINTALTSVLGSFDSIAENVSTIVGTINAGTTPIPAAPGTAGGATIAAAPVIPAPPGFDDFTTAIKNIGPMFDAANTAISANQDAIGVLTDQIKTITSTQMADVKKGLESQTTALNIITQACAPLVVQIQALQGQFQSLVTSAVAANSGLASLATFTTATNPMNTATKSSTVTINNDIKVTGGASGAATGAALADTLNANLTRTSLQGWGV